MSASVHAAMPPPTSSATSTSPVQTLLVRHGHSRTARRVAFSSSPSAPPPPHHDTTLTLALALPPPPFAIALSPRPLQTRRPDGGASSSSSFARVRSSPTGDPPPCTECDKKFTSWKALFGHMRCHPERQWRGIMPPPHFQRHQAVAVDQFTVQEREIAKSLLMLAEARPGGGKGKKSVVLARKESCSTTPAAASAPLKCDDHRCSVCARGFATGQALGGHKRCHWEGMVVAAPSNCSASSGAAAAASMLDLNLPPPGTMPALPWKSDEDGSLNAALDLKLGY